MLYTIGYEGLTQEQLVDAIARLNARLIDVRGTPHSRKRGFSGKALNELLGDRYQWHGDCLGNKGTHKVTHRGIELLHSMSKSDNVVILCLEANPADCHRHNLITSPYFPRAIHLYPQVGEAIVSRDLDAGLESPDGDYDCWDYEDALGGKIVIDQ
jgi:uncharacterized protein (DUF488 family)